MAALNPRQRRTFLRDRRGATMVEYALLTAMIAVALVATFESLSTNMAGVFETVDATIEANHAQ